MGRFILKGVVDAYFTIVVFFSVFITSNLIMSNPLQEELCKGMFCGDGRCEGRDQFPFVECICNHGWTNFNHISSLPCVLPNCTINSQCGNSTPSPPPLQSSPAPSSFQLPNFSDPCSIDFCGVDGTCILTNGSDFNCQCSQGSTNLLNNPKFPCFHKCNLGEDCEGVNVAFNGAPPPSGTPSLENSLSPTDNEGLLCGLAFCGKGRCEDSKEFPLVNCICDEGWTNFYNNSHLPCVIPNCTIDFSCGHGSPWPPLPPFQLPDPLNYNPCWIDICGPDGKCVKDGSNPKCQCSNDSANLLGNPKFPCFKKCHLGGDCNGLDLGFNQPSPPPPTDSVPSTNGYTLNGLGKHMLSLIVLVALLLVSL